MVDKDQLRNEIRTAFGSVAFPAHRGIRGAMAADDWVSDSVELEKITLEKDVHGEWWTIPAKELQECTFVAQGVRLFSPVLLSIVRGRIQYADIAGFTDFYHHIAAAGKCDNGSFDTTFLQVEV